MAENRNTYEETLDHVSTFSRPSELKITDMRFAELEGCPFPTIMMKLYTNQGIVGYGEVRDMGSKVSALVLKTKLLGENPCNIDRIFRKIMRYGGQGRLGGGVSAVEMALWDLAGKAYGAPVYSMLGGKFRDKVRIYCDTDVEFHVGSRSEGEGMAEALKKRLERGYTILKMDLGIGLLAGKPGMLTAPLGYFEEQARIQKEAFEKFPFLHIADSEEKRRRMREIRDVDELIPYLDAQRKLVNYNMSFPFPGIQITEKGLDYIEDYVREVRSIVGYDVPIATDHHGNLGVDQMIRLARRLEKYNIAWLEDPFDTRYVKDFRRLKDATTIPICTGENIYLADNFKPLLENEAITIAHPDPLTAGGIWQTKKTGDLAEQYGVRMCIHQAATPIHAMAAAHAAVATKNFWACEFHANDIPWWSDLYTGDSLPRPLVQNGFIDVPDLPGIGIEGLNDDVIKEHISSNEPGLWEPTDEWNHNFFY